MVSSVTSAFVVFLILFIVHGSGKGGVMAQAEVAATAPLAAVKEGGILSLHCQIWKQNAKQRVIIAKRNGDDEEQLSWDKRILQDSSRYFLAHRKLKDGSDVYFLSITEVTRSDEGDYVCIILAQSSLAVEKEDSVHIGVRYFPSESFPVCDPTGPRRVLEGTPLTLNCSSEPGKPPVKIHWSRTGSDVDLLQTEVIKEDGIFSEVTLKPKMSDQDAMFVCQIESKLFTNKPDRKCHMGPLTVIRNPDIVWPMTTISTPLRVTEPKYTLVTNDTDDCHEVCAEMTAESVFRWTIATVIAGLLALVFFIFGIFLLVRYCLALDDRVPHHQEEIPDMPDMGGVQYRIDGNRLYMTLERPGTSQTEAVYQGGEVLERQYILAPSRGDFDGSYIGTPPRRDSEPPYLRTPVRRDSDRQSPGSPIKGAEADNQSPDNTTIGEDLDRQSYQGTPVRNGGSLSLQGTPTRILMDKVLTEAQSEGYIGTPTRRESEGYIGTPTRGESERLLFGTPTRGESERQRSLTPTLPPRRYKSHYV